MVLKLYAHPLSGASQRAAVVLYEKQVPFELIVVDLFQGSQKAPEYVSKHPFGQVPCLDDDGFLIFESRAIARYVATKYATQGPKLIPTDLKAQALLEQAIFIETSHFDPFASKASFERIIKKMRGLQPDEEIAKSLIATLDTKLDAYEKMLNLFHLPYGARLYVIGEGHLIDRRPNVKRWWDDISSRPSWLAVKDGIRGLEASK